MIQRPKAVREGAAPRLLEALAGDDDSPPTLALAAGVPPGAVAALVRERAVARVLVLSRVGAHRDARAPALRALWELEERARASGLPTLTLRFGPLVGPRSPLWLRLGARPRLPRGGRQLLNPVCEEDAVETLARALDGRTAWEGWYEVAGPEVWSLAELAALAAEWSAPAHGRGAWEPPLAELEEHRLCEAGPWLEHFGMSAAPLAPRARRWAERAAAGAAA